MRDLAPAFGQRFGFPLLHRRMCEDAIHPGLPRTDVERIGPYAIGDRREERIDRAEGLAGQPGTAEARQAFLPELAEA